TVDRARSRAYVDAATRRFREELAEVVSGHVRAGVAPREALGDPAEFATKAVRALAPLPSPWNDLVGPFTVSEGVQARLGISRQAVAAKGGAPAVAACRDLRWCSPVSALAVRSEHAGRGLCRDPRAVPGRRRGWLD